MANRFLDLMDRRGKRSLDLLKRLYRAACKRVHPDAAAQAGGQPPGGTDKPSEGCSSAAFLVIRREYEEALAAISAEAGSSGEGSHGASESAKPWSPGAWNQAKNATVHPKASSQKGPGPRQSATISKKQPIPSTSPTVEEGSAGQSARPSIPIRVREPPALGAFRDACARLGADIRSWDQNPYRFKPTPETVTELLVLAHAVSSGRLERELGSLETVLASLLSRRAELARYPGIMTRYSMLYRALAEWEAWRSGRGDAYLSASRTRLVELENPTVTLLRSNAIQDVTDAFPGAARFLRVAWGLPGDELSGQL